MLDIFLAAGFLVVLVALSSAGSLPSTVKQVGPIIGCLVTVSVSLVRTASLLQMLPWLQQTLGECHYWRHIQKLACLCISATKHNINNQHGKEDTDDSGGQERTKDPKNKEHHLW